MDRWRRLKTGSRSEYAHAARVTEDIRRIFRYERLEINSWLDNQTLQIIINGRAYKLGELGSGIAQFIIVLANAAVATPSYILIDEPELNLHPSLQSDFLTSLASYATEGVIFATHNTGLALNCADRIYAVRRTHLTSRVSVYNQTPHLSEFLGELGYTAYRDLGFDKILLVEGSSEVKLIGGWLRLYGLSHKVVLLHLGGFVTERRATDNYLTERAIQATLGPEFRALSEFESLKKTPRRWKKTLNWRIGAEMSLEELKQTDLDIVFNALRTASAD